MIVIPTWCRDLGALYGSVLTLQTVHVGFDDDVLVIDNGSLPEAREKIGEAARAIDAKFIPETEVPHWVLLRQILTTFDGPLVIADPDLIFWQRMTLPDAIWSGRLIPRFHDEYTGCITMPRLHTSLWYVPQPKELIRHIESREGQFWEANMLRPMMLPSAEGWIRYDTGAVLYADIGGEAFDESQLDCYDHLFCGSHLKHVAPMLDAKARERMTDMHAKAERGDIASLRGMWRAQQQHFIDRSESWH